MHGVNEVAGIDMPVKELGSDQPFKPVGLGRAPIQRLDGLHRVMEFAHVDGVSHRVRRGQKVFDVFYVVHDNYVFSFG